MLTIELGSTFSLTKYKIAWFLVYSTRPEKDCRQHERLTVMLRGRMLEEIVPLIGPLILY